MAAPNHGAYGTGNRVSVTTEWQRGPGNPMHRMNGCSPAGATTSCNAPVCGYQPSALPSGNFWERGTVVCIHNCLSKAASNSAFGVLDTWMRALSPAPCCDDGLSLLVWRCNPHPAMLMDTQGHKALSSQGFLLLLFSLFFLFFVILPT